MHDKFTSVEFFWIGDQILAGMLNDPQLHATGVEILEVLVAHGKAIKKVYKSGRVSYEYAIPAAQPKARRG